LGNLLKSSLKTSSVDASGLHDSGDGPGTTDGKFIAFYRHEFQQKLA
jgi:carbonic anhydrase